MWSHYANQHEGVVIELACIDEIDNTLLSAKPVIYSTELPEMGTLDDFVMFHTGQVSRLLDSKNIMDKLTYTKSIEWEYEKEWRVWIACEHKANDGYYDYLEHPNVFKSLYLGCRISDDDERSLIQLVGSDPELMHMEIYKDHYPKLGGRPHSSHLNRVSDKSGLDHYIPDLARSTFSPGLNSQELTLTSTRENL